MAESEPSLPGDITGDEKVVQELDGVKNDEVTTVPAPASPVESVPAEPPSPVFSSHQALREHLM